MESVKELYDRTFKIGTSSQVTSNKFVGVVKNLEINSYTPTLNMLTEEFIKAGEPVPQVLMEFDKSNKEYCKLLRVLLMALYNGVAFKEAKVKITYEQQGALNQVQFKE